MSREKAYLLHIREACEWIGLLVARGKEAFLSDELIQDSIIRKIEIIGEASKQISADFRELHPKVPWREASETRNALIHGYFGVDLEIVWQTASKDIPELSILINEILQELM